MKNTRLLTHLRIWCLIHNRALLAPSTGYSYLARGLVIDDAGSRRLFDVVEEVLDQR